MPKRILIACEESQAVCIEFRKLGYEAFSCDILPSSGGYPKWHLQMDVFEAIKLKDWDVMIAFPDCTYLTCSAEWAYKEPPYHQKVKEGTLVGIERKKAREEAILFVKRLWNCGIDKICIENPVGVLSSQWKDKSQIIQPYNFGDDASKKTCLWLKGLPPLTPTKYIKPRYVDGKRRWSNQTDSGQNKLPPSKDRAKLRSKTYLGVAKAIASQWSHIL